MNPMFSELRQKLEKLTSWINEPRLYIVQEMDATKNEIDIFAERFLMRASKSQTKSDEQKILTHDTINSNRRQMIAKVEAFEKKLLTTVPTNDLVVELVKKLTFTIDNLEKKLQALEKEMASSLNNNNNNNTQKDTSELKYAVDCTIYEFDCAIKQKSSLLFINVYLLKKFLNSHTNFNKDKNRHAIRKAQQHRIEQPESEIERDDDEVEYKYPDAYVQLDAATTFGVLFILDDCVSREEFM